MARAVREPWCQWLRQRGIRPTRTERVLGGRLSDRLRDRSYLDAECGLLPMWRSVAGITLGSNSAAPRRGARILGSTSILGSTKEVSDDGRPASKARTHSASYWRADERVG